MTFQTLFTSACPVGCFLGALLVLPVVGRAAGPRPCIGGKANAASYTWNFQKEATGLLNGLQVDAGQVQRRADLLDAYIRGNEVTWDLQSDQLDQLRDEVNDMGRKLCRLVAIRGVLAPWQQNAVDRIAPRIRLIADNAADAIAFLNHHQHDFRQPPYELYVRNLYRQARRVSATVEKFEAVASASRGKSSATKSSS